VSHQIIVTVKPDGTISAKTHGITGANCLDDIDRLEQLLLAETVESHYTADFHRTQEHEHESHTVQGLNGV